MARRYFPSGSPIGRQLEMQMPSIKEKAMPTLGRPIEIVGIVKDAKYNNVRQEAKPMCYVSVEQFPGTLRSLEIRTTLPAAALAAPVRQALFDVSKDIMIRRTMTLASQVDGTLAPERLITGLCTFFGALALLLASIGLYGVMAYGVAQRTNEIGIRMALGASRSAVLAMVLRQSLLIVLAGLAMGLPLAWASTRALSGFLFGLSPTDPTTIAAATVTLLAVAGVAAYLPARRATRVDPLIALRYE
jgi:predicted lysophospholipase L1 biosynthesis ABC-type transport system permease subunit